MSFPVPEGHKPIGALTVDETALIIEAELRPEHFRDANIMTFIRVYLGSRDLREAGVAIGVGLADARRLRNRKDIHGAISKVTAVACLKYGLDPDEIVEKVKAVAFFDPIELVEADGSMKTNLHDMSPEARRAIKKIEIKNLYEVDVNGMKKKVGHVSKIEMWDKLKALEFLGREKGLFKETTRTEFEVGKNMKEVLLAGRGRASERMARLQAGSAEREVIDVGGTSSTVEGRRSNVGGDSEVGNGDRGSTPVDGGGHVRDVQSSQGSGESPTGV